MSGFSSLSSLRKNSGNFDNLMKEVDKIAKPTESYKADERFWQPSVDKAGNGYAVIRFLAPPKAEELPWVRIWNHGFQGPTGKWYIENSLTTLGQNDPLGELNTELWNTGIESNKNIARKQKRKLTYISNILVITDSSNPQNEGKVFLYKYGKKIFDKIKDIMQPQFEDETPVNPFDFWAGAPLKLKIRQVEGFRNYDKSEFDSTSPVADTDELIEAIWNQEHSLSELLDPKHFKSYEDLKRKLDMVLGTTTSASAEKMASMKSEEAPAPASTEAPKVATAAPKKSPADDLDEEDPEEYFKSLAAQD